MPRIVCHFSCGAASAVATKLALTEHGRDSAVIFNAFIQEEDSDNRRFLEDCQRWFGHPVTVLRDTKYGASAREVWRRERYMNGPFGASCSTRLKREVIEAACLPDDRHVMGFVVDEKNQSRIARGRGVGWLMPCVDRNLTHADCRGIVERAGLVLPRRYAMGYGNANCVGCCKGGQKYWRKTLIDSPADFVEVAAIQREIGPGAYFFRNRETGERWPLDELPVEGPIDAIDAPGLLVFLRDGRGGVGSMKKQIPSELDCIADKVLGYKPPEKAKATKQRQKRKRQRAEKKR